MILQTRRWDIHFADNNQYKRNQKILMYINVEDASENKMNNMKHIIKMTKTTKITE